ncbi:conserved hypothetical protein [Psychromonas ingrahamii 37]|uniref:DUF3494 domain-containing protein n=1 Tax=Psychromonas ingrahamii (strain DSM 17664 / CCUG 51855 / 37) TaxID=357804 RepID=A1SYJ1_PSYIN|nr:ice-binding family protein [Psychromonas ingrahamii]ABM04556.1 conserved hypothetical protein [Psychromonas ingrahamii 37]
MNTLKNYSKKISQSLLISGLLVGNAVAGYPESPVQLNSADNFAVLSKSGITNVSDSIVTGDVGASPITGAATLLTCSEVVGDIYATDANGPAPCSINAPGTLGSAIGDMGIAYNDAAGRVSPDETELGAGEIGGLTLTPGLYKWSTDVGITSDVTLKGNATDVWILQIAGTLSQAAYKNVTLAGGALAENVFWQVADSVTIGTGAHFEGIILGQKLIAVNTGATVKGRLFAQTAVTLQKNKITEAPVSHEPSVNNESE